MDTATKPISFIAGYTTCVVDDQAYSYAAAALAALGYKVGQSHDYKARGSDRPLRLVTELRRVTRVGNATPYIGVSVDFANRIVAVVDDNTLTVVGSFNTPDTLLDLVGAAETRSLKALTYHPGLARL